MAESQSLDAFAGRLGGMAARYAALGSTLEDAALVKKLLDSVPNRLYAAVAGIEQFCDVGTMLFEDALGRLKAFDERLRRRDQAGGEGADGQLLYTAAQWRARERRRSGARGDDDDDVRSEASRFGGNRRGRCYKCGERGHFKRECPQLKKAPAAERALLVDDVEDAGLL
ncbi:uncharacterized protein [Aegilops tauschii subsp. strangulata]|uniref:CCHC-type domain-containing protein n=2 Tax=Aegilops tauschii subsp. strangulata TaxID=200361 RepID=A0A453FL22_AEGTS|nr:uncharacterized protein LOC109748909 [Aegilops tauschii subsp. strangulata]XP_045090867.1 uncharacterized protein LOC109748909 [Aegilops tauschii subsp. strangulata]